MHQSHPYTDTGWITAHQCTRPSSVVLMNRGLDSRWLLTITCSLPTAAAGDRAAVTLTQTSPYSLRSAPTNHSRNNRTVTQPPAPDTLSNCPVSYTNAAAQSEWTAGSAPCMPHAPAAPASPPAVDGTEAAVPGRPLPVRAGGPHSRSSTTRPAGSLSYRYRYL